MRQHAESAFLLSVLLAVMVSGFLGSASARADGEMPADLLKGRRPFMKKGCGGCHAIWGAGNSSGPEVTKMRVGKSLMQLAGNLWNHSPGMIEKMSERRIPRPVISAEEMREITTFLYSMRYFQDPGRYEEGERLFVSDKCASCHTLGGQNKTGVNASLDKYSNAMSPLFLITGMWNHTEKMTAVQEKMSTRHPDLNGEHISHLAKYIHMDGGGTRVGRLYVFPGSPSEGERLFREKECIKCHAESGREEEIAPDFKRRELPSGVTEVAAEMINKAGVMLEKMKERNMKFHELDVKEMADLLAYLCFVRFVDEPGDPARGKQVYDEKGCGSCHGTPGEGGAVGKDMAKMEVTREPLAWAAAMWNHAPDMEQKLEELGMPWPHFEGNDMRDLEAYLRSVR